MKSKKLMPPVGIDRAFLKEWARVIVHTVHRADEKFNGPFVDDAEYEAYLWLIQAELFRFFEESQRRVS